jgi:PhnB protein
MSISTLTPHLVVNDGEAAIAFYEKAFGAVLEAKHPADDGKRLLHVHLELGQGALFLHDDFPEFAGESAKAPSRLGGASCIFHLDVADADFAWEQATKAGATVLLPLANQAWGMRYGQIRDPFGHIWSIGGPVK